MTAHDENPNAARQETAQDAQESLTEAWRVVLPRSRMLAASLRGKAYDARFFIWVAILGLVGWFLFPGSLWPPVALAAGLAPTCIILAQEARRVRADRSLGIPIDIALSDSGVYVADIHGEGFHSWSGLREANTAFLCRKIMTFVNGRPLAAPSRESFSALLRARFGAGTPQGSLPRPIFPEDMRQAMLPIEQRKLAMRHIAFWPSWAAWYMVAACAMTGLYSLFFFLFSDLNPFAFPLPGIVPGLILTCLMVVSAHSLVRKAAGSPTDPFNTPVGYGFDADSLFFHTEHHSGRIRIEDLAYWSETEDTFIVGNMDATTFFPKAPWSPEEHERLRRSFREHVGEEWSGTREDTWI